MFMGDLILGMLEKRESKNRGTRASVAGCPARTAARLPLTNDEPPESPG
jgi:hypothetical protein